MAIRGNTASGTTKVDSGWGLGTGVVSDNAMVPVLFAKKMEALLYVNTVYDKITNTNWEGELKNQGDFINVRIRPTVAITAHKIGDAVTYVQGTDWTVNDSRELKVDQGARWSVGLYDEDATQSDIKNWMSEASADATENMQIHLDANVLDYLCDPANHVADNKGLTAGKISSGVDLGVTTDPVVVTGGSSGTAHANLVYMSQILREQDVAPVGNWVVLPYWFVSMLQLGDLKRADVTADSVGMIRKGFSGQVAGLDVYESNQVPDSTASYLTTGEFAIPFGVNDACTFALQINKSETLRLQDYFQDVMRGLCIWGRELVFPERAGVMIAKAG